MSIEVFGASYVDHNTNLATGIRNVLANEDVTLVGKAGAPLSLWSREKIPGPGTLTGKTVAVLELGGNGVPTAPQVTEAEGKLAATGASRVVWFAFTDWPDPGVRDKRVQTAHVVAANVRHFVALPTPSLDMLAGDRIHMTPAGYRSLGASVAHGLATGSAGPNASNPTMGLIVMGATLGVVGFLFWKTAR